MTITQVKVRKIIGREKLRGTASITFNDVFMVHDLKIIEGSKGLFVAMPAVKINTRFKDIAHPITSELREEIITAVLDEYNNGDLSEEN